MSAHTAVGFTRYMMLSLESREVNDQYSLRGILLYFTDKMSDITWTQAFQMLLEMFRIIPAYNIELTEEKIDELESIYEHTSDSTEITPVSSISQRFQQLNNCQTLNF